MPVVSFWVLLMGSATPPAPAAQSDPASVVFRIKTAKFVEAARALARSPDDLPLTQPLAGDLVVAYAIELPGMFRMMNRADLASFGLSLDALHAVAVANVRRKVTPRVSTQPPVLYIKTGDDLEACVLLLDEVWSALQPQVPGELVALPVSRDILLITSSTSSRGLQLAREVQVQAWNSDGDGTHRLSDKFLVRRGSKWEFFEQK